MRDRQRPLLVAARRHEDPVVHVVEPRQVREVVVDLRHVVAILVHRLGGERDAALASPCRPCARAGRSADDRARSPPSASRCAGPAARRRPGVSTSRAWPRAAAIVSGLPLKVPCWRTRPSRSARRARRSSRSPRPAGRRRSPWRGDDVGRHAEELGRAARGDRRARLDLVEDQHDAVRARELAHAARGSRRRGSTMLMFIIAGSTIRPATWPSSSLSARSSASASLNGTTRVWSAWPRVAGAVGDAGRPLARRHLVGGRLDRDHHRVVVAVVGALDLDDHVAAGDRAREVRRRPSWTRCRSS